MRLGPGGDVLQPGSQRFDLRPGGGGGSGLPFGLRLGGGGQILKLLDAGLAPFGLAADRLQVGAQPGCLLPGLGPDLLGLGLGGADRALKLRDAALIRGGSRLGLGQGGLLRLDRLARGGQQPFEFLDAAMAPVGFGGDLLQAGPQGGIWR